MLDKLRKRLERLAVDQTAGYLEDHSEKLCEEWLQILEVRNPRYAEFEKTQGGRGAGLKNLKLLVEFMRADTPEHRDSLKALARQMGEEKARLCLPQGYALEELLHSVSIFRSISLGGVKHMLASRFWLAPPWDVFVAAASIDEAFDIQMAAMSEAYLEARDEVIRRNEEDLTASNLKLVTLNHEMQHRIRNNLQTVADLFSLELVRGIKKPYEEHLRECVVRLKSIAAVHDLLSADNIVETDIRKLAEQVVSIAVRSVAPSRCRIEVAVEGESVNLPSKRATSFALVLNELVSNAIEHGFKERDRGTIKVSFKVDGSDIVAFVDDDGLGLEPDFDLGRNAQTGLHVAAALIKNDLGGSLTLENGVGARAIVRFRNERKAAGSNCR